MMLQDLEAKLSKGRRYVRCESAVLPDTTTEDHRADTGCMMYVLCGIQRHLLYRAVESGCNAACSNTLSNIVDDGLY